MRATELPTVPKPTSATLQVCPEEGFFADLREAATRFADDLFFFIAGQGHSTPGGTFLHRLRFLRALGCPEKMIVQMTHAMRNVAFLNHEADINFRGALRNHADVYAGLRNGVEHVGGDSGPSVNIVAN